MAVGGVKGPGGPSANSAHARVDQFGTVTETVGDVDLTIENLQGQEENEGEAAANIRAQVNKLEGQAQTTIAIAQAPAADRAQMHRAHPGLMAIAHQLQAEASSLRSFEPAKKNTTDQVVTNVELVGKKMPPGLAKKKA